MMTCIMRGGGVFHRGLPAVGPGAPPGPRGLHPQPGQAAAVRPRADPPEPAAGLQHARPPDLGPHLTLPCPGLPAVGGSPQSLRSLAVFLHRLRCISWCVENVWLRVSNPLHKWPRYYCLHLWGQCNLRNLYCLIFISLNPKSWNIVFFCIICICRLPDLPNKQKLRIISTHFAFLLHNEVELRATGHQILPACKLFALFLLMCCFSKFFESEEHSFFLVLFLKWNVLFMCVVLPRKSFRISNTVSNSRMRGVCSKGT